MTWQSVTVYAILTLCVGFAAWWIYRSFSKKKPGGCKSCGSADCGSRSSCDGCGKR